jgi:serine/threonine protein kinase
MARVPASYCSLAGPPSLESCTRDMYPPERRMGLGVVLRMALGIASATAHLHARGVLHGDLYAHNTMVDGQGDALLGDFGAAALYDPARTALAARLQRLEVRALGLLLQELVQQVLAPADAATPAAVALQALASECISEVPAQRPRPVEVVQRIELLSNS